MSQNDYSEFRTEKKRKRPECEPVPGTSSIIQSALPGVKICGKEFEMTLMDILNYRALDSG